MSSTYLFHEAGGVVDVLMAWTSRSSINRLATIGLMGDPIAAPSVCLYVYSLNLDVGCFSPSKAKKPKFSWVPFPATKTTTTTTMAINTHITTSSPPVSTSCKTCKKWGAPCPFCIHPAPPLPPGVQMVRWGLGWWKRKRERGKIG